jgi:hypothetical protein
LDEKRFGANRHVVSRRSDDRHDGGRFQSDKFDFLTQSGMKSHNIHVAKSLA